MMVSAEMVDVLPSLCIVIPAYKADFFAETMSSLSSQIDKRFSIVVGDDAGPPEIARIVESNRNAGLDLRYRRFDDNLGGRSLTAQWQRCIDLTDAEWIMLLGDDDCLDPGAVAAFHDCIALDRSDIGVWRFDTRQINSQSQLLGENIEHPSHCTAREFVRDRFLGRSSYVSEFVVRRRELQDIGGFVPFPAAWCSDDATWVRLSLGKGIGRIAGPKVSWRLSGRNISSPHPELSKQKMMVLLDWLDWLDELDRHDPRLSLGAEVRRLAVDFVGYRFQQSGWHPSWSDVARVARRVSAFSGVALPRVLRRYVAVASVLRRTVPLSLRCIERSDPSDPIKDKADPS